MPQLHLYVPAATARLLQARARAGGVPVSQILREIVDLHVQAGWPEGYLEEVLGGWEGRPVERPEEPRLDAPELL